MRSATLAAVLAILLLAGCAAPRPQVPAGEARALVARYLPPKLADKEGWAADIHTPMAVLGIALTPDNICAILSVTEQETGYQADPPVPNLAKLAWAEIERQRQRLGIPALALDAALSIESRTGASYRQRIDAARTERQLSDVFEEMIDRVPLGRVFFAERNPVRTGGPMQVGVAFAIEHARRKRYPYPVVESIRDEVFTRRGGMYFGIAHLLDYPADYDLYRYRYADFNAGHYASRNAAFQAALARLAGRKLALDGDLVRAGSPRDAPPGETEAAARSIAGELGMDAAQIRRDLEQGKDRGFEETRLYRRVFELADRRGGKPVARAVVPAIQLQSAKFTRKLTTQWFAERVVRRHRQCLARRAGTT
ncbi:MAG TPA: DUF1615 domain-containing protein [Myxococcota bacterium]|nr:DUF1615 domain-containing protein [Myxococcota bacterium]